MPPTYLATDDDLSDFRREMFTADASTTPGDPSKPVYWIGEGPGIVVMPEIPGLTPEVAGFARRLSAEGFTVAVPSLFGSPGRAGSVPRAGAQFSKSCVSKEFTALATGTTSPVTPWLRALVAEVHGRCGGPGVGVLGMCFTGGFVLGLMVESSVLVAVASQPSLPLPLGKARAGDLGLSPGDLTVVKERLAEGACAIGLRFTEDPLVRPERFERMRVEFGDGFIGVEIDSSKGNAHGFARDAHSVLTMEYDDTPGHPTHDAYQLVIDHMKRRLL